MEKPRPQTDISGNGEPPRNTRIGTHDESDRVERAISLIRQMGVLELRELTLKYNILTKVESQEEIFNRAFENSKRELIEHFDPEHKMFRFPAEDWGEGYQAFYDFEEIYGRWFFHHKDEKPSQRPHMIEFNRKLLIFLKELGWKEADDVDPSAIY